MSYNIWQPSNQGELYHYGVIGMKWGVHKMKKYSRQRIVQRELEREKLEKANRGKKGENLISKDSITTVTKAERKKYGNKSVNDLHYGAKRAEKQLVNTRQEIDKKATRKLQKINAHYEWRQARADRKFDKAERKSNSLLTSERSARKAFRKASKEQFKANKVAARGKKWYEQMAKEYKKAGLTMTKENQEIGKELIRQVRANSRAMYAATYVGGK